MPATPRGTPVKIRVQQNVCRIKLHANRLGRSHRIGIENVFGIYRGDFGGSLFQRTSRRETFRIKAIFRTIT